MLRHLDLFSGIGGFALATEMVWEKVEHIFCDIEPFAQAILKKHWPNSKIYGDIRTLTNPRSKESRRIPARREDGQEIPEAWKCGVDLLTGGFPCQPFSQAGKRRGTEDDRHLWPEMLRVIREFHPRWIIGENVGGFVTWNGGMVLEQVHADLEGAGYEVQAFIIPACAVGAPHRRDRVWIVANASGRRLGESGKRESKQSRRAEAIRTDCVASDTGQQHGEPRRDEGVGTDTTVGASRITDTERCGETGWNQNWLEVATTLCRVDDGIPRRLDRTPRLKGLGNAIVPQVAAEIMRAIKQSDV